MPLRHSYSTATKTAIVAQVCNESRILERTIRKWVAAAEHNPSLEPRRRGPKPRLPHEAERHLYEWIVGRQILGYPVDRSMILKKAQDLSLLVTGKSVGPGWYQRFTARHPDLTTRVAQSLSQKRNCV
ncbi:Hypothetical protein PHPALM_37165, partial [Phytophthora palmivora]